MNNINKYIEPNAVMCKFYIILFVLLFSACDKDQFESNKGTFIDDRDGHEYKWVKIGDQIWMAENLAYTPFVCSPNSDCGIYVYDYSGEGAYGKNYTNYGVLYDWHTAQEVCPEGWHLPTDEEWMTLELFLGMEFDDLDHPNGKGDEVNIGGKLKDADSGHWDEPNMGATNETGFSALPGGYLNKYDNRFYGLNRVAAFWTASEDEYYRAMNRKYLFHYNGRERESVLKEHGYSVRCIKD